MTATLDLTTWAPAPECDEFACRTANTHPETCRCSCQGDGHGVAAQVERVIAATRFQSRRDVTGGFTSAMLAEITSDEAF